MRTRILILGFVMFWAGNWGVFAAENTATTGEKLDVASDGTAKATGLVLENNLGCEVDLECYPRVKIADREIRVTYSPAEGPEQLIKNWSAGDQGFSAKKGERVTVYGKYRKAGTLDMIEIYSNEKFYIHILPR
jgi:hypothetical protein